MFNNVQQTQIDLNTIAGLMELIAAAAAHPKKVKDTLADLKGYVATIVESADAARAGAVDAEKAREGVAEREAAVEKAEAKLAAKKADLDAQAKATKAANAKAEGDLAEKAAQLDACAADLKKAEKTANANVAATEAALASAKATQEEYETKLAELNAKLESLRAAVA